MEIRSLVRIVVFAVTAAICTLQILWLLIILPEILQRNLGFAAKDVAMASAYFYNAHFAGMIVSCFLWPAINRKLSKRASMMLGLVAVFTFNTFMAFLPSFLWLCFWIFMVGVFSNTNSIGKDFIFEFVLKTMERQYALSVKSMFNIVSMFGGPFLGYSLYRSFGADFSKAILVISALFLAVIIVFFFVFFVDYDLSAQLKLDNSLEESEPLSGETGRARQPPRSMWVLFKECFSNPYLRSLMLTYIITNAFTKSANVIIIIYSESLWSDSGLGLSSHTISLISLCSILPSLVILLQTPLYVPKRIHYFTFIRFMVSLMIVTVVSVPIFRDVFTPETINNALVFLVISFIFWSNPKTFSPFVNFLLNSEVGKHERTTLNASLFFMQIVGAMVAMQFFAYLYKLMLYSSLSVSLGSAAKYIPFSLLAVILAVPIIMLNKKNFAPIRTDLISI